MRWHVAGKTVISLPSALLAPESDHFLAELKMRYEMYCVRNFNNDHHQ